MMLASSGCRHRSKCHLTWIIEGCMWLRLIVERGSKRESWAWISQDFLASFSSVMVSWEGYKRGNKTSEREFVKPRSHLAVFHFPVAVSEINVNAEPNEKRGINLSATFRSLQTPNGINSALHETVPGPVLQRTCRAPEF